MDAQRALYPSEYVQVTRDARTSAATITNACAPPVLTTAAFCKSHLSPPGLNTSIASLMRSVLVAIEYLGRK
jgi:hypothetical protein